MTSTDPDIADLVRMERLGPALVEATGDARWARAEASLISGGKSNLTFSVASPAGELVMRRPPSGPLLPRAHDMMREARVQAASSEAGVPVAKIVIVDAGELIGVPCYVMERVPGHVIRDRLPDGYATTAAERNRMGFAFVDALAALHRVDAAAVGLADYGHPDGYAARQVRTWTGQWERSKTRELPAVEELARRLSAGIPEQITSSIVHGDYRIDNCVFDAADPGRINAVLDWELSTLGDPLADLGYLLMFWQHTGEKGVSSLAPCVTDQPGFPTRTQVLDRYSNVTGIDGAGIDFYIALAHLKFAVIIQGVARRSTEGAMGGQAFGVVDEEIARLAQTGLELI